MPFSGRVYDPETLTLMTHVLDEAWQGVQADHLAVVPDAMRTTMALLIMQAVDNGIRNPEHLKRLAMIAVEARLS